MEFDFNIIYRKGTENIKADALSQQADYIATDNSNKLAILTTNKDKSLTINKGINVVFKEILNKE